MGFVSEIRGREFAALGSRRRLSVWEPVPHLGHHKTPGPSVVLATRTVNDLGRERFSRAFAVSIAPPKIALPNESDNERIVEESFAGVLAEEAFATDRGWIEKRLRGRGEIAADRRRLIDDTDRVDLGIGFRGVGIEEETMGYRDLPYRSDKLTMFRARAATRPIIVVDLSDLTSDQGKAAAMGELKFLLRSTFIDIRRDARLPPGVLGVVPSNSWFAEHLKRRTHASVA
jgi:hypothetical protein